MSGQAIVDTSERLDDLDYLASIISPEFSTLDVDHHTHIWSKNVGSLTSSPATSPEPMPSPPEPVNGVDYSQYSGQAGMFSFIPTEGQYFFPPNFDISNIPQPQWNSGINDYIQSGISAAMLPPINLTPIGKTRLKTRRRASRSKCPCVKCCHARANAIPSPTSHACMVDGCTKSYTRPAHLRAHLKSHQNDASPKCVICRKWIPSIDLFISHMFAHGMEMKV